MVVSLVDLMEMNLAEHLDDETVQHLVDLKEISMADNLVVYLVIEMGN